MSNENEQQMMIVGDDITEEDIKARFEDGKRPFFTRRQQEGHSQHSGNARTIDILKKLGAEVKGID